MGILRRKRIIVILLLSLLKGEIFGWIFVTHPQPYEVWVTGETHSINWESGGLVPAVTIELYKGDSTFRIIAGMADNIGYYSWNIPMDLKEDSSYTIKVSSISDSSDADFIGDSISTEKDSIGFFTIKRASIIITNPDNDAVWETRTTHTIRWSWIGEVKVVKIELYHKNTKCLQIISSTPCDGEYEWYIPKDLKEDSLYRIKITNYYNSEHYGYSDYFTIKPSIGIGEGLQEEPLYLWISPNPFSYRIEVRYGPQPFRLEIYNVYGALVIQKRGEGKFLLDTKILAPGVYFCRLKGKRGIVTQKLIKIE